MSRSARTVGLLVLLTAVVTAGAPSVIRIRPGDTLSALARAHHTTVARLQAANHLHGTVIYAGQLLSLPGNAAPAQQLPQQTRLVPHTYLVRPGDNLTRIATKLHTRNSYLVKYNHLRTTRVLIGQHLGYAVLVQAAPRSATGPRISQAVTRSAAQHRAWLGAHRLPSKAAVRALIVASAKRHGVPPSLALALAYQESGFQQRVVSPVDAIGVMQVLPSTARVVGRSHGRRYDLLSTPDNIEAGVTLLKDLLNATGSAPAAMAGYYQGLGSVGRRGLLPQTKAYITNITLLQRRFS